MKTIKMLLAFSLCVMLLGTFGVIKAAAETSTEKAQPEAAAMQKAAEVKAAPAKMTHEVMNPVTEEEFVNQDIYFGYNSFALSEAAKKIMAEKAAWLKANPDKNITIQVSCDPRGNEVYNKALAQRRAKSIVKSLTDAGIAKSRIKLDILGSEGSTQDKADWPKERRGHFVIQ